MRNVKIHNQNIYIFLFTFIIIVFFISISAVLWKQNIKLTSQLNKEKTQVTEKPLVTSDSQSPIIFSLSDIRHSKSLGENLYIVQAKGTFISLYLDISNQDDNSLEIDPKHFALVTADGETYGVSGEGQSGRDLIDKKISFFKQSIAPQSTLSGQVTFDVLNPEYPMELLYKGSSVLQNVTQ